MASSGWSSRIWTLPKVYRSLRVREGLMVLVVIGITPYRPVESIGGRLRPSLPQLQVALGGQRGRAEGVQPRRPLYLTHRAPQIPGLRQPQLIFEEPVRQVQ